jgi:hypothetical protein
MDESELRWIEFCRHNPSEVRYWFKKACDELSFDIMKVESNEACQKVWNRAKVIWLKGSAVMASMESRCGSSR